MTERQQQRKRIHSHITKSRFLHVEDALSIGKVRLFAGQYRRGEGASATAFHFLDLDDARVLLADLSWGKPADFVDFKGTSNGDGPQSRVLKVKAKEGKVWFEVQNGPGQVIGQGAVKPAGKPDAAVSIPLSTWEGRKLAHAVLAYIRAWEVHHLLDQVPTAPANGDSNSPVRSGSGAPPVATPSPVVTESPAGERAPVTTGQEVPATVTGFWTLYNADGRAAGVAYPHAQNIANKYGGNGSGDWQNAIERLCEAIDEASALALD